MSKLINVFVCDKNGYGLSSKKANLYMGAPKYTDKHGYFSFIATDSNCTVYVEGRQVYNGSVSNADDPIVCARN